MHLFSSFLSLTGKCAVCQNPLRKEEHDICTGCLSQLPMTNLSDHEENILEKHFWGHIPIVRASSLFIYHKGADSHLLLRRLKYMHQSSIGLTLGRIMATYLQDTAFFDEIDMIVPVPLAKERLRKRGYNQSAFLAEGIHEITQLPVVSKGISRIVSNKTQTSMSYTERFHNVEGIFKVESPERFYNKHILIVDDVVTSTATIVSLANTFEKNKDTHFSILTLAMSSSITEIPYYKEDNREDMENQEDEIFMPES